MIKKHSHLEDKIMTVADFAKLLSDRSVHSEAENFKHDHSLGAIAREHTVHTTTIRAGTVFDWEDLERYQEELARLDREGPGSPKQT